MAIECKQCGGLTMPETVIKLRRGLIGFRETRSQGTYCPSCKRSALIETPTVARPSIAFHGRPRINLSGLLPTWLHVAPARAGGAK